MSKPETAAAPVAAPAGLDPARKPIPNGKTPAKSNRVDKLDPARKPEPNAKLRKSK